MYVVGIDENGFGPVLGPLVVTATVFELDEPYTPNYLWESLTSIISKDRKDYPQKLTVYDSKEVFKKSFKKGYEIGEATVLTFYYLLFKYLPSDFDDFLSKIEFELSPRLKLCEVAEVRKEICEKINSSLPIWGQGEVKNFSQEIEKGMKKSHLKLAEVQSLILCPARLNKMFNKYTKSYSSYLQFEQLSQYFQTRYQGHKVSILCSKIGSQNNYNPYLKRGYFKNCKIKTLFQKKEISRYHLASKDKDLEISFIKAGDKNHFPIALASLFGKYIREVFMHWQNQFFQKHDSSLPAVSGYRNRLTYDFIKNSQGLRKKLKIPEECFIRQK